MYSLDENGDFTEWLSSSNSGTTSLNSSQLSELKNILSNFVTSYDEMEFSRVYDLKAKISQKLIRYLTTTSLEELETLGININYFHTISAKSSGIIEYYIDGYESVQCTELTLDDWDKDSYSKTIIHSGDWITSGDAVYKTITSENWSIVFPIDEETAEAYADVTSVKVNFPEKNLSATVNFELVTGADDSILAKISLSRYMVQYAGERYLEVILQEEEISGLKIPCSAVITEEFLTIPIEYITTGGNSDSTGFQLQTITDGETSIEFISPTIYYKDEEYYYVSATEIPVGSVVISRISGESTETQSSYVVSETASLTGVYNVNKGYAVFKVIEILDEDANFYQVT